MGIKEESLPVERVFGFSGRIRPLQIEAGLCTSCQETVYVDPGDIADMGKSQKLYVHFGCSEQ